jgi:hypothetical protein
MVSSAAPRGDPASTFLKSYMGDLTDRMLEGATLSDGTVGYREAVQAIQDYAPLEPVKTTIENRVKAAANQAKESHPWRDSVLNSINGVTILSAALTILFGTLALARVGPAGNTDTANGFLDIAKIFAGAIVGSTASGLRPGKVKG